MRLSPALLCLVALGCTPKSPQKPAPAPAAAASEPTAPTSAAVGSLAAASTAPEAVAPGTAAPPSAAPEPPTPDGAVGDAARPDGGAPDGARPDGASPDGAAPSSAAAPASAPPTVALDPREGRAAARCSKLVAAVAINGEKLSTFAKVAPAFAAVQDGGLVWICPGAHPVKATLLLKGRSQVTVAGRDALVLAVDDLAVLRLEGGAALRVLGVSFGHAVSGGGCASDVVQAKGVKGLLVRGVGLHGSGVVGLALDGVSDAVVEDSLVVECQTGLTAVGPRPTTRRNRFVLNDRHLGDGLTAGESDTLGPQRVQAGLPDVTPLSPDPLAGAAAVPLDDRLGKRWAILHTELFTELNGEACGRNAETGECTKVLPADGAAPEHPAAQAKALTVLRPDGPCVANLGPLQRLEHRGCEPSVFQVREVLGCAGPVAPMAFVGGEVAAVKGLRWVPRTGIGRGDAAPPELDAWAAKTLADDVIREPIVAASPGGHWAHVRWIADAGKERLVTHGVGIQLELGDCHVAERSYTASWVNDAAFALPDDLVTWTPWVGVLAREGRVWAVAARGATLTQLFVRQGATVKAAWEGYHSAEHDECLAGWGPLAHEYPCGP